MSWAKVDDRFHGHSKARRAREALALWVLALAIAERLGHDVSELRHLFSQDGES